MNRRRFLTGLAGILASGIAPAVLPAGSIMRIKPVLLPEDGPVFFWDDNTLFRTFGDPGIFAAPGECYPGFPGTLFQHHPEGELPQLMRVVERINRNTVVAVRANS